MSARKEGPDIKAIVDELVAKWGDASKDCEEADAFVDQLVMAWPTLLPELRRLWAIEERAERYREAWEAYQLLMDGGNDVKLAMSRQDARHALFAALRPKETT